MNEAFWKSVENSGHVLERKPDGTVNYFALNEGHHNGPRCTACGQSWCEHCLTSVPRCPKSEIKA